MTTHEEPTRRGKARADLALVRRVLAGSRRARTEFMDRMMCVPRILAAKNARMGNPLSPADLDDLTQETLLAVWKRLPTFEGRAALETWVYRFCHLSICKFLDSRERHQPVLEIADEVQAEWPRTALDYEFVYEAIEELEPKDSVVVELKQFSRLTFEEIGKRLNISPNTAKTRYYRGIDRLREILEPKWSEDQR